VSGFLADLGIGIVVAPLAASQSAGAALLVLAGVGLGSLAWYSAFTTTVALVRRRGGDRLVRAVDIVSGLASLVGFGGLLATRALRDA